MRRLRNIWYKIGYKLRCIFKPHNVLTISNLPRTWIDRDEIMFHAIFQILVDFVELEQPFISWDNRVSGRLTDIEKMRAYVDYWYGPNSPDELDLSPKEKEREEERRAHDFQVYKEILYLYEWYKNRCFEFDDSKYLQYVTKEKLITYSELYDIESKHELVCDVMLRRVLAIRRYLWT